MIYNLICAGCLLGGAVLAQSPVVLTIDTRSLEGAIPDDFAGVCIFTGTQGRDHRGVRYNEPVNPHGESRSMRSRTRFIALCRNSAPPLGKCQDHLKAATNAKG